MSPSAPRLALRCDTEDEAKSLTFAVNAVLGRPQYGVRGVVSALGGPSAREGSKTGDRAAEYRKGGDAWLAFIDPALLSIVTTKPIVRVSASGDLEPVEAGSVRENVDLEDAGSLDGFLHGYLEDLDPNLDFDVATVEASRIGPEVWAVEIHSLAPGGTRKVELSSAELAFQIRGLEADDHYITWRLPFGRSTEDHLVAHYLRVRLTQWEAHAIVRGRADLRGLFSSFAGAFVFTLSAHLARRVISPLRHAPLVYDEFLSYRLLVGAGRAFVSSVLASFCPEPRTFHVFDELAAIASMGYERRSARGTIMFCDASDGRISWSARLKEPVSITDRRRVRKLLETSETDADVYLISDSIHIFGVGKPVETDDFLSYSIEFVEPGRWTMRDAAGVVLMGCLWGSPHLPVVSVDYTELRDHLRAFVPSMPETRAQALFAVAQGAVRQRQGTTIVVSNAAEAEARRLSGGGFPVYPAVLSRQDAVRLTSIDGALLLDAQAKCHAVGVILDGISDPGQGDPARGARYNSALRYVFGQRQKGLECAALVISEDGHVDRV